MTWLPRRAVGWILAAVTVAIVLANQAEVGLARDELVYMDAGDRYADWWLRFAALDQDVSRAAITSTFGGKDATANNREHPPLMKTLFGLSHRFVAAARTNPERLPGASRGVAWLVDKLAPTEVTTYRLPTALLHGLLVLLVFLMVLEIWGFAEALASGLLIMFLPRALFHAGLAAFDAPIMALWFAAVYAYWRCLDGRRWPWQVGVVFGLALATKHNAFLLPFAFILHYPIAGFRARGWPGIVAWRWRVIVSLMVLAPLTLIAVWPWLWFDTIAHVRSWLMFHTSHVHYHFEYLGTNHTRRRFVARRAGHHRVPRSDRDARRGRPRLRAVRGPAHARRADARAPARAVGGGLDRAVLSRHHADLRRGEALDARAPHAVHRSRRRGRVGGSPGSARVQPPANASDPRRRHHGRRRGGGCETLLAQPYALSSYTALAGGAPGGADLGMNRQFWGVAARGVLPVLAREGAPAAELPVYAHDASPAWELYHRLGLLPRSRKHAGQEQAGIDRSTLAIVVHEKHFNRHDHLIWKAYRTLQPFHVLRLHGVPIVSVYRRPVP